MSLADRGFDFVAAVTERGALRSCSRCASWSRHLPHTGWAMNDVRQEKPAQVEFRQNRLTAAAWVVFASALALQGGATIAYFQYFAGPVEPFIRTAVLICGAGLIWFGWQFGGEALRRLRDPRPPVVIGPAGLHDRAVSERPVPWSAIGAVAIRYAYRGGRFVAFDIAPHALDASGVRLGARIEAAVNRALGYPGYRIHMVGVDADPDRLLAAIAPHAKTG
jgi:hypothetical protein